MKAIRVAALMSTLPLMALGTIAAPQAASAKERRTVPLHLPAGSLAAALRAISLASGRSIAAPAAVIAGKLAPAIDGDYSVEAALRILLKDSGLRARAVGADMVIEPDPEAHMDGNPLATTDIVVTGSRIAGVKSPSPVISVRREAMRSAGRTSIDEVIRTIPQNFSGGQNPGVSFNVPEARGSNIGGSSSVNLRGIGSDATLTLLDGHRLPYSAAFQSVDISAIPFNIVDRIEVVPDGASAIYGSDAVAGVVNVILRRDVTGIETTAKIGASTEGGYLLQQYDALAGTRWRTGNIVLAYEYDSNSAINGSDRRYTAATPNLVLYPPLRQHDVAALLSQQLAPNLSLSVDALFGRRSTNTHYATNPAGDLAISGYFDFSRVKSFSVVPVLDWRLGAWTLALSGSYGDNRTSYSGGARTGTVYTTPGAGFYTNRGTSAEFSANGPIVRLPSGEVKAAFGVGWRNNDFYRSTGTPTSDIRHAQSSYYAFGELNLPLVRQLTATAALRYERYPGIGEVVTPKLGAVLSVSPDIDLKASWGKSFRAPTLYDQYQPMLGFLIGAAVVGGRGLPAGSTALVSFGGNPDLKPERSTNWSAGIDLHPRSMAGLDLSLSFFSVDYTDRIVTPITFITQSLSNPAYAAYVQLAPSAADQAAFIAESATFANQSGAAYDASKVAAIVRNQSINAGSQQIRGVDAALHYGSAAGPGRAHLAVDLGYLTSRQRISIVQPFTQLAGIVFNPPHLKGRAEIGYTVGGVSLTGDLNYIGPVRDTRRAVPVRVPGMTPIDLALRYKSAGSGVFGKFDIVLAVQNALDETPGHIAATLLSDVPYDSTNYTPLGRVVSLSVTKKW